VYGANRSIWRLAHTPVVDKALHVSHFTKRGLPSLAAMWKTLNPRLDIASAQLMLGLGQLAEEPDVSSTSPVL